MLLNTVEKALMNNPLRAAAQRRAALIDAGFEVIESRRAFDAVGWFTAQKPSSAVQLREAA